MKSIIISVSSFFGFGNVVVEESQSDEPLFRNVSSEDVEVKQAHELAKDTTEHFIELVKKKKNVIYMAKLRFRDPELSEQSGKDQFSYIWLTKITYHPDENLLSGVLFEIPKVLEKWHKVGDRLGFEPDDIFDWMVNDNGKVQGAFTIRLTRSRLETESEKLAYDKYVGITNYEA